MTPPAPILIGQVSQLVWMRVEGKGSFQNSMQVKRCFQKMMDRGEKHFIVDLERCPIMDSTFIGTLTGAALNLRATGGEVCVLNANTRNQQLLSSLGLDYILDVDYNGTKHGAERRQVSTELGACAEESTSCSKAEQAEHVLEAHKALTHANEKNVSRFRDVIEFLESELHPHTP